MSPDQFQTGDCGTYALALQQAKPASLSIGSSGYLTEEGYEPQHLYAHDDKYAYDSRGTHLLPYHGSNNQFNHHQLHEDPDDYGLADEADDATIKLAQSRAKQLGQV